MVQPRLPEAAKRAGLKGPVLLEVRVDEAGNVAEVRIVRGDPTLNSAAETAVRQWKYEPQLLQERPMSFWSTVVVNFREK